MRRDIDCLYKPYVVGVLLHYLVVLCERRYVRTLLVVAKVVSFDYPTVHCNIFLGFQTMGLFRSRLSRRQSRRSQREHMSANDSTSDDITAPGNRLNGGGTTSKQVIRKVLVYLVVIGFLQLNQWKKKKVATTNTSPILSRLDDQVYIINNALPLDVAIRWRNALHHEWSRAQNGEWQYCSSPLVCNTDNIRSRNESVHALLQLENNKDAKGPSFLQSKWVLGPDQHHIKSFLRELNTDEIQSRLVDTLLQIVARDNDSQPQNVIRILTSDNLIASHFTTGDFDNNIIPGDNTRNDDMAKDRTSYVLSFHITLLQPPTTLEGGESTHISSSLDSWHNKFGGILVPAKGYTNNNLVENNDEFATSITPQFNSAVIWKRHDSSTSTISRRMLTPISWLAEETNARLYVISGDFLIQTTTTTSTKASNSSLEDPNGNPTRKIGNSREQEEKIEL